MKTIVNTADYLNFSNFVDSKKKPKNIIPMNLESPKFSKVIVGHDFRYCRT